jgi:hypothetical protein
MMNVCLKISPKPTDTNRPKASELPPAANGTMILTGLVGHVASWEKADMGTQATGIMTASKRFLHRKFI